MKVLDLAAAKQKAYRLLSLRPHSEKELEKKLREVTPKVHEVFHKVNHVTRQASDKAASPFIAASAASAQVKATWRGATSLIKRLEV